MDYNELLAKSLNKINTLHPTLHLAVKDLIFRAHAEGIFLVVTEALRTKAYQQKLYNQGRFGNPGKVVTWTLKSNHLMGLAFDVAIYVNGKITWPEDSKLWNRIGEIGKALGLLWGGDWAPNKDLPHFEWILDKPGGRKLTYAEMEAGKRPSAPPY